MIIKIKNQFSQADKEELLKQFSENGLDVEVIDDQAEAPIALEDPSGSEADGSDREGESGVVSEARLQDAPIRGSSDRDEALPILDDQGGNAQPQARG